MTKEAAELKIEGTASIGAKGQIVIPKTVREKFNFNPGTDVVVVSVCDATILIKSENLKQMIAHFEKITKLFKESREN